MSDRGFDIEKEAERLLMAGDPTSVQMGLGLSNLALARAMKANRTTLNSRKPGHGDVAVIYCSRCEKETQCSLRINGIQMQFADWICLHCGRALTASGRSKN